MPFLLAILAAIGGAIFWWARSNPRDALGVADDVVTAARNAPRKLAFRRQTKEHPVEGIDDPRIAIAMVGRAYIALDDLPTREAHRRLHDMARILWKLDDDAADEVLSLADWLVDQCQGAAPAVSRGARRLYKIDGAASWGEVERLLGALDEGAPTERQQDAVADVRQALHLR